MGSSEYRVYASSRRSEVPVRRTERPLDNPNSIGVRTAKEQAPRAPDTAYGATREWEFPFFSGSAETSCRPWTRPPVVSM